MNLYKKNILIGLVGFIVLFTGCSGRTQINPNPAFSDIDLNQKFDEAKKVKNEKKLAYQNGYNAGYNDAKKEIKEILPYLESLRAAAVLKNNNALCLPPVFIDKSQGDMRLIIGKAHICDGFTMKNIFDITKNGIPGLPDYYIKRKTKNLDKKAKFESDVVHSSIVLDTAKDTPKSFIEKPTAIKKIPVIILDNYTNREILRNSNYPISNIEAKNNYLLITFSKEEDKNKFCNTYNICKQK